MTYRTFDGTSQEEPIVDGRFSSSGDIALSDGSVTQGAIYFADDKNTGIYSESDGQIDITTEGKKRFSITNSGVVILNRGHASDNSSLILDKANGGFGQLSFEDQGAQKSYIKVDSSENTVFSNTGTLQLYGKSQYGINIGTNGLVELRYLGSSKLETNATGVGITNTLKVHGSASGALGAKIVLQNTHSDPNGYTQLEFQDPGTNDFAAIRGTNLTDGSNNGYLTFYTRSATTGLTEQLKIADDGTATFAGDVSTADNKKLLLGTDNDVEIYFDNTNAYIKADAPLYFGKKSAAQYTAIFIPGGSCELYNDNVLRFKTYSGGTYTYGDCNIVGTEGVSAAMYLIADDGDDNGDVWRIVSNQDHNDLTFANNTSGSHADKLTLTKEGNVTVTGAVGTGSTATNFDARIGNGVAIPHSCGVSIAPNTSQTDSRSWRIRPDDSLWGGLDFSVSADKDTSPAGGNWALRLTKEKNAEFGGHVIMAASKGIEFSHYGGDDSNAATTIAGDGNLLDDYEEGTWVPQFSTGFSAAAQTHGTDGALTVGSYTKIGNLVNVSFIIRLADDTAGGHPSTSNGARINISGLPFTSASTSYHYGVGSTAYHHFAGSSDATAPASILIGTGGTVLDFYQGNTSFIGGNGSDQKAKTLYGMATYHTT